MGSVILDGLRVGYYGKNYKKIRHVVCWVYTIYSTLIDMRITGNIVVTIFMAIFMTIFVGTLVILKHRLKESVNIKLIIVMMGYSIYIR